MARRCRRHRATLQRLGEQARTGPYVVQAPSAVVVATAASPDAVSATSRAIRSTGIAAWTDGVGSNRVGFHGLGAVKPVLGIPERLDLLAIVPVGYPACPAGVGKKERKPPAEAASRGRYGQPCA